MAASGGIFKADVRRMVNEMANEADSKSVADVLARRRG
jgi:hypothetical protein